MRFAVIATNGRDCFGDSFRAISSQVDHVYVTETADGTHERMAAQGVKRDYVDYFTTHMNISRWWNRGLERADRRNWDDTWEVAIVNDDCIVPDGWMEAVCSGMRQRQAVAGCSGAHDITLRVPEPVPLDMRMQGFAFVLAGEKQLRFDEQLTWWCGDDDMDWRSREAGGMSMIRGFPVQHLYPNGQMTPELHVQVAGDMQRFVDKWGRRPW